MNIINTNKFNVSFDKEKIFNDFDIFEIELFCSGYVNLSKILLDITKEIIAIKFIEFSTHCAVLIKKDATNITDIENAFKTICPIKVIKYASIRPSDEALVLNLLLFEKTFREDKKDIIIANSFKMFIDAQRNDRIKTLAFEFKNDYLIYNLETFTRLTSVSAKDSKKPKYAINGIVLSRVIDESKYDKNELFVIRNYKSKNSLKTFDSAFLDKSKFYFLSIVYTLLSNSEYIETFEFETLKMDCLHDNFKKQDFEKSFTEYTNNYCKNIINNIGINLIFQDASRDEQLFKETFKNIGIENVETTNIFKNDKFNFVILETSKPGVDKTADRLYANSYADVNIVSQHININDFIKLSVKERQSILSTCINNFIVKYELKNKNILSFNWEIFNKFNHSKYYKFIKYYWNINENLNNYDIDKYYIFTIYNNGKFEIENFDILPEKYDGMLYDDSFLVEDDKENIIRISDTNYFVIPIMLKFIEELDSVFKGREKLYCKYFADFVKEFDVSTLNKQKQQDFVSFKNVFKREFSSFFDKKFEYETVELKKVKKIYLNAGGTKSEFNVFVKEFETFLNDKYDLNLKFKTGFKNTTDAPIIPGIRNIHYNNDFYISPAYKSFETSKDLANNITVKKIDTLNGNNFSKDVLFMLFNPIVKLNSCTVYPFIIKYIREYALMQAKSKS